MKVGDKVTHKLCGLKMTITKISETIAVCRRDEPWFWKYDKDPHYTAICQLINLAHDQEKENPRGSA